MLRFNFHVSTTHSRHSTPGNELRSPDRQAFGTNSPGRITVQRHFHSDFLEPAALLDILQGLTSRKRRLLRIVAVANARSNNPRLPMKAIKPIVYARSRIIRILRHALVLTLSKFART